MSEWISVEDRLPEEKVNGESDCVLAFNGYFFPAKVDYVKSRRWFETVGYENISRVTHWMPLPTPPINPV